MVKHLTEALTCARWSIQDDTFGGLNSHFFIILWMCERQLHWLLYETTEHVTASRLIQVTNVNIRRIQFKHWFVAASVEWCGHYLIICMTFSNLMVLLDSHRTEKFIKKLLKSQYSQEQESNHCDCYFLAKGNSCHNKTSWMKQSGVAERSQLIIVPPNNHCFQTRGSRLKSFSLSIFNKHIGFQVTAEQVEEGF